MTAMRLKRYPSSSGGFALGKMGVGATTILRSILPAGARWVEYLGFTGTQWIDTGVAVSEPSSIVLECDETVNQPFGFTHQKLTTGTWLARYSPPSVPGSVYVYYANYKYRSVLSTTENRKISKFDGASGFYVDGVLKKEFVAGIGTDAIAQRNWIYGAVYDFYASRVDLRNSRSGNVYSLKIQVSNLLVRDFRPIAIGTTGYMLDLISGEYLQYGNKGTGDFVIGPDINAPAI